MKRCVLTAPAKINLYLEIIGDRPDGFHELAMVMQSVALADQIEIVTRTSMAQFTQRVQIRCNHPDVPTDASNLAHRAASLILDRFPDHLAQLGLIEITIDKRLPIAAGLAGGSSNAAAVLIGLDLLAGLGLTQSELCDLAAEIGSDVPFCVMGGTAIATGRGEQVTSIASPQGLWVLLGKYRHFGVSTPWAYQTFRQQFSDRYISDPVGLKQRRDRVHSGSMVEAIGHNDRAAIGQLLYNDLERVVLPVHPPVAALRQAMAAGTDGQGADV
ncbi:MAG: 4-(cytidine 5'-diphospho)-2-C-methyl-D-erythritol kinase, partial [Oscillatoriales cyanobacterium]